MSAYSPHDLTIIRDLAKHAYDLALSDEMETRRARWRAVNGLRQPDRAPVWWRAFGAWETMIPSDTLRCTDETCRGIERGFRQDFYQWECGLDHVWPAWYPASGVFDCEQDHALGLPFGSQVQATDAGGFRYEHPVRALEDYDRLTPARWTFNSDKSATNVERMAELLGEAMPVRLTVTPPLVPALGTYLENLRGMAQMLDDLAFHPERVHRAMAALTEACLAAMRAAEASGQLSPNNTGPMFCSDPIGETYPDGKLRLHNLWGSANSQEFQEVSPRMQEEFLLNYQIPLFQQCGLVQYGCCEDLTHKIEAVLRIPNLRVFVSSYWTDLDKVIEATNGRLLHHVAPERRQGRLPRRPRADPQAPGDRHEEAPRLPLPGSLPRTGDPGGTSGAAEGVGSAGDQGSRGVGVGGGGHRGRFGGIAVSRSAEAPTGLG